MHTCSKNVAANLEVALYDWLIKLIEFYFLRKNVSRHVDRSSKSPSTLIKVQNGIKAGAVSIEEIFVLHRVEVHVSLGFVAKQGGGKSFERRLFGFEPQTTNVDCDSIADEVVVEVVCRPVVFVVLVLPIVGVVLVLTFVFKFISQLWWVQTTSIVDGISF